MLNLTKEQNALFCLLKGKGEIDKTVDWDEVKKEALDQAVFLIASTSRMLPEEVKKNWEQMCYLATVSNVYSLHAISEMDRIMKDHGFPYVILKGLSAASYYPSWFCRILGDVDFLIDSAQRESIEKILESEGYTNWNTEHICHVVFRKEKQHLEMHFEISGIPYGIQGEIVREYMSDVFAETTRIEIKGREYSLPLPKHHGLILLLHMQHHMLSEGIGLRHWMDWCCFVNKTHLCSFWESDLLPVLKRIGLYRYAQVMTRVGSIYLDIPCPPWAEIEDDDICDEIMKDILTGGNFGTKNKMRSSSGMMISQHGKEGTRNGKVHNLYITLHNAIRLHHPIVGRFCILYPLFDLIFIFRRIFRTITKQRTPIMPLVKYANERKKIYDKLKIFEI